MAAAPLIQGLGDKRRDRRGSALIQRMSERTSTRIRVLAHSRAEEVAFSRFLTNPHFGAEELRDSLRSATQACCAGREHVVVLQDTSEINFQHHAARVSGLGPVGNGRDLGLFVHALLALDARDQTCLGLLDCRPWIRTPRQDDYRRRPIEEKESARWLEGLASAGRLGAGMVTTISDRESDCFELFARRPHERCHLLIRACRDRAVAGGHLFAAMGGLPTSFGYTITLPARPGVAARRAHLVVRFGGLELKRPKRSREPLTRVAVSAVEVCEVGPTGLRRQGGVCWRLLTTHPVEDASMAAQVIAWYAARWHVEQLVRTLKSQGLDLEASQSEDAHALRKLAVMAAHAGARILQLVQARDGADGLAAGAVFEPFELEIMQALFEPFELEIMQALLAHTEGQTDRQTNPHPPDTLAWCAWIIARLGGWKGYRHSEGPPGPLTMRRGYDRFCTLRDGYQLAHNLCKP